MQFFEHIDKRTLIISGLVIAALAGSFFYWLSDRPSDETPPITELSSTAFDAALGRELLTTLAKLKSTVLDTGIFDDPVFASLQDFGIEIAPQPVGRRNPFAEFSKSATAKPAATPPKPKTGAPAASAPKPTAPKAPQAESGFDTE